MKAKNAIAALLAAAVAVSVFCPAGVSAANNDNLLTNPDASNGLKGWTDPDKTWVTADKYSDMEGYDGDFFMPDGFSDKGGTTSIYQEISVKGYAGKDCNLSGYMRTTDSDSKDRCELKIEFIDESGKTIDWGSCSCARTMMWGSFGVTKTIPDKAVTARVSLCATHKTGDRADCFFDDVSFTIDGVKKSGKTADKKAAGKKTTTTSDKGTKKTPTSTDKGTKKTATSDKGTKKTVKKTAKKSDTADKTMAVRKSTSFKMNNLFKGAKASDITWHSEDDTIVSVDSTGKMTANSLGTTRVTATYGSDTKTIEVTVK